MPKPYDSTTKFLVQEFPADWLALAGLASNGPIELIDTNLSTITAEADKVIRVAGPTPWLVHFELQSARDTRLASRLHRYNALLDDRHNQPTRTVAVLLRPEADGAELTGEYRRGVPGGPDHLVFQYDLLRVWQEPATSFLEGGLGTVPLASVADLAGQPIEDVLQAIGDRIDQASPSLGGLLWVSTSLLMGLRYPAEVIEHLMSGVRQMEESTMYQAILAKGEARGEARGLLEGKISATRNLLAHLAERRFGPSSAEDRDLIAGVTRLDRLEQLHDLLAETSASTWPEFWAAAIQGNPAP